MSWVTFQDIEQYADEDPDEDSDAFVNSVEDFSAEYDNDGVLYQACGQEDAAYGFSF